MTRTSIAVSEDTLAWAKEQAAAAGLSVMDWLGEAIEEKRFRERLAAHDEWRQSRPDLFGPEATGRRMRRLRKIQGRAA